MHFFPLCVCNKRQESREKHEQKSLFCIQIRFYWSLPPDFLLIRCCNAQFIPEIRMCQRNEQFPLFPMCFRPPDSQCHILLRYRTPGVLGVVMISPSVNLGRILDLHDERAYPIRRCHADKAFAAGCVIRPCGKVQLSAGTGKYCPCACAFRGNLSIQVNGDTVVDGNHIFHLCHNAGLIHIVHRERKKSLIFSYPIIKPLGTQCNAEYTFPAVQCFPAVCQFTSFIQIYKTIGKELCVTCPNPSDRILP